MAPADKISSILDKLKVLRKERTYTLDNFYKIKREMQPHIESYKWHIDEFMILAVKKNNLFKYKIVKKELNSLISMLNYIKTLLKKREFVDQFNRQNVDISKINKAIETELLWVKDLKAHNKECRRKMRAVRRLLKMGIEKKVFEQAIAEWDNEQMDLSHLDRVEDNLEQKAVEIARQYPETVMHRMGIWQRATVYAIAVLIGLGVYTADINKRGFVGFGNVVMAEEVHDKAFYDKLAKQAEAIGAYDNPYKVIQILEPYKLDQQNLNSNFFNELGLAYIKYGRKNEGYDMLKKAFSLNNTDPAIAWNLGVQSYKIKGDIPSSKRFFNIYIQLGGKQKDKAQKYINHFIKKGY